MCQLTGLKLFVYHISLPGYRFMLNTNFGLQDLRRHFSPYHVVSEKISRDEKTGVSKEVGFARYVLFAALF